MKAYREFKKQVEAIKTQNNLIDAQIAICKAYSSYQINHEQFSELRKGMIAKRTENNIAWGKGI